MNKTRNVLYQNEEELLGFDMLPSYVYNCRRGVELNCAVLSN